MCFFVLSCVLCYVLVFGQFVIGGLDYWTGLGNGLLE